MTGRWARCRSNDRRREGDFEFDLFPHSLRRQSKVGQYAVFVAQREAAQVLEFKGNVALVESDKVYLLDVMEVDKIRSNPALCRVVRRRQ